MLGTAPTTPGADPGGGKIGALLLNSKYIHPGTVDTTGSYNHYSALRSFEDLLGLTTGGADGDGHLGFAAAPGLTPFGQDIFQPDQAPSISTNPQSQSVVMGNTLTFTAAANITTPTIQWQLSVNGGSTWINVQGQMNPTLTTGPITAFENNWQVRAVFTNYVGSATTNPATITVTPPTTNVVLPSNGATLSGSLYLDATSSPGVTNVQYELNGNGLSDDMIATGTPDHLRVVGELEHHERAERHVYAPERRLVRRRSQRDKSRHHHHGKQRATYDHCRAAFERRHVVGQPVPRRHLVARGHQRPV